VLLERLPIFLVGCVFNGDGVITLADFAVILHLPLDLLWNIIKSRRGTRVGDILGDVVLQNTTWLSTTTPDQ
jgi:hypothetical protein